MNHANVFVKIITLLYILCIDARYFISCFFEKSIVWFTFGMHSGCIRDTVISYDTRQVCYKYMIKLKQVRCESQASPL